MPDVIPGTSALPVSFQEREDSKCGDLTAGVGEAGRGARFSDGLRQQSMAFGLIACICGIAVE